MKKQIIIADSVAGLKQIPDNSVELVVTSPPYDDMRTYGGKLKWDFKGTATQIKRILVSGGVCCWNVNNSTVKQSETCTAEHQKIFFVEKLKLRCHDTMIWDKNNFANPERARYHQMFEYVFIFSKGKPRAWNPIKDKPNSTAGRVGTYGRNTYTKRDGFKDERQSQVTAEFGMRGNVWRGNTRGQEDLCKNLPRTAMMPKWLARDLILSFSNNGDTVLDCFGGSGTTGMEALKIGRNTIIIEKDPKALPVIEGFLTVQTELA